MSKVEADEASLIDRHEKAWIAQGYQVVRSPSQDVLPDFLGTHVPDAILLRPDRNVIVEIVHKGQRESAVKVQSITKLLAGKEDWRLELIYSGEIEATLPLMSLESLRNLLQDIRRLSSTEPRAALVLLWAAMEALARLLEPQKTKRPQSPGRVVELLAGAGHITPSDAETIRSSIAWRNRLVHGDITVAPSKDDIEALARIMADLIQSIEDRAKAPV